MDQRESKYLYATYGIISYLLTDKEKQFLESVRQQIFAGCELSLRQEQWLGAIRRNHMW
jgi:hypothetical protein